MAAAELLGRLSGPIAVNIADCDQITEIKLRVGSGMDLTVSPAADNSNVYAVHGAILLKELDGT
jgi:hypothetical protein